MLKKISLGRKPCGNPAAAAADVTFHHPSKSYNHLSLDADFHATAQIQPATSDVHWPHRVAPGVIKVMKRLRFKAAQKGWDWTLWADLEVKLHN